MNNRYYELKKPKFITTWQGDAWLVTTVEYSGIFLHDDSILRTSIAHHTKDIFTTSEFKTEAEAYGAINKYYARHRQPRPYFFAHGKWREIPNNGQTTIDVAESQVMRFK